MTKLHVVADGKFLHLPEGVGDGRNRLWLNPGGVVDLEDPYVVEAVRGQEYKLRPAPATAKAADSLPPQLIGQRADFMRKLEKAPPPPSNPAAEELVGAAAGEGGDIPAPDIRKSKQKG